MKVERYHFINSNSFVKRNPVAFRQQANIQTLKYVNIGSLSDGFIGKSEFAQVKIRNVI